ncbi:hypothetical protein [Kitasatospora griseola]|uniref:hypothetical protein n=1 Tax=Kitasatospora griseola TaxID=2064 RepID=UPI0034287256
MSYSQHELNLTFDPTRSRSAHFLLEIVPDSGFASSALNAEVSIEQGSRYVREWFERLRRCEPNPLHTTLVGNDRISDLFHPCVDEAPDSPSAVGTGCVCRRTFTDPEFGLPVIGVHFRTDSSGGPLPWKPQDIDQWTYRTYAPLGLRDEETCTSLIIDQRTGLFWMRTSRGVLTLLPERSGRGYGVGYGGGGPGALAEYIQQLVDSDGKDTVVAGAGRSSVRVAPGIEDFVQSEASRRTQELTLAQLRSLAG